ncbi:MAG: hypothetical protein HC871_01180 [Rhizobiales bacterium]|nr:hypothetical protein [Hyphomicrobiales bacterium]
MTGAVSNDVFDLADVLTPPEEPRSLEWLRALAEFHEWPIKGREEIESVLRDMAPAGPEIVLATLVQALVRFEIMRLRAKKPIILQGRRAAASP